MSHYLKTEQAAALINVSRSLLEKLRLTGKGPRFIKIGRAVFYDRDDLEAWVNGCKVESTSEAFERARINHCKG